MLMGLMLPRQEAMCVTHIYLYTAVTALCSVCTLCKCKCVWLDVLLINSILLDDLQDTEDGNNAGDTFLSALKSSLHSIRKSFTGQEFVTAAEELYGSNQTPSSLAEQFGVHVQNDPSELGRQLLQNGVIELVQDPQVPGSNFLNSLYRFRELEDVPAAAGSSNIPIVKVCCSVRTLLHGEGDHTPMTYAVARVQTLTLMCSALTKRGITNGRIAHWHSITGHPWNYLIRF